VPETPTLASALVELQAGPSALLAKWSAITEAAVSEPWEAHSHGQRPARIHDIWHDELDCYIARDVLTEADAIFISAARTAMPRLLAAVEAVLEVAGDLDSEPHTCRAGCTARAVKLIRETITDTLSGKDAGHDA